MSKIVGIMGGTFNPIHNGHLSIADIVLRGLNADEIRFIPAGDPPHKRVTVSAQHRLDMTRLAVAGRAGFTVSDIEITRQGPSYTYMTLAQFNALEPDTRFVFIVGDDMLRDIMHWRRPEEILRRAALATVPRPGYDIDASRQTAQYLRREYSAEIFQMQECGPEISSTGIRGLIQSGQSISGLVPQAVEEYIRENGLYTAMENAE